MYNYETTIVSYCLEKNCKDAEQQIHMLYRTTYLFSRSTINFIRSSKITTMNLHQQSGRSVTTARLVKTRINKEESIANKKKIVSQKRSTTPDYSSKIPKPSYYSDSYLLKSPKPPKKSY